jgi:chorismate synthase
MLRFLTAGESHGQALVAIVEGLPAGLPLSRGDIDGELKRRQIGYGRGERMKIEADRVQILSGVRFGKTLGSPMALFIANRDWENWRQAMSVEVSPAEQEALTRPRPGHADLAGAIKYDQSDIRNILERASARETASRVAIGAVAKKLLREFHISVVSHVIQIGPIATSLEELSWSEIMERAEASPLRCADKKAQEKMILAIDEAQERGDTLGGISEIRATGCPPGLGSHVHWDRRLDARFSYVLMSIPGVKGVEIGMGFKAISLLGSQVQDEIHHRGRRFTRPTNNAGGIEGGISNGQDIVVRVAMKPIPTLGQPLRSVDIRTKKPFQAFHERADICVVPAVGVIGEALIAFEIGRALCEKFGSDSLEEMRRNFQGYVEQVRRFSSS